MVGGAGLAMFPALSGAPLVVVVASLVGGADLAMFPVLLGAPLLVMVALLNGLDWPGRLALHTLSPPWQWLVRTA